MPEPRYSGTRHSVRDLLAGGAALGGAEEPTGDELRQTESLTALLLREGHHAEGGG